MQLSDRYTKNKIWAIISSYVSAALTRTNKPPALPASLHPMESVTMFLMLYIHVTKTENTDQRKNPSGRKVFPPPACCCYSCSTDIAEQLAKFFHDLLTFFLVWVPVLKLQPEQQQKQCLMLLARSLSLSAWKSPSLPNYHQMVSFNSKCACTSFESRLNPEAWPWDFFATWNGFHI